MADDTTHAPQAQDDSEDNALPDSDEQDNHDQMPAGNAELQGDDEGDDESPDAEDVGPGQHDNAGGGGMMMAPGTEMPATTATTTTPVTGTGTVVDTRLQKLTFLNEISQEGIYLMGLSFLLGVLFTVFILLVLDFMRRNQDPLN